LSQQLAKHVAVMDTPHAKYTVTKEGDRLVITGGAHEDAYAPVDIPVHEAQMLIVAIEMICGLGSFKSPPQPQGQEPQ
jgi:hypothetical protein